MSAGRLTEAQRCALSAMLRGPLHPGQGGYWTKDGAFRVAKATVTTLLDSGLARQVSYRNPNVTLTTDGRHLARSVQAERQS